MSGITKQQYANQLRHWNEAIDKKCKLLDKGYRVYQLLYFVIISGTNISSFIAAFLSSLIIGYSTQSGNSTLITIFSSIAAVFSLLAIICTAFDIVFKPQSTASQASYSGKLYADLYRELEIEVLSVENTIPIDGSNHSDSPFSTNISNNIGDNVGGELYISYEKFKAKLLYYSAREQVIAINEPGLVLIGYRSKTPMRGIPICETVLNADEVQFMIEYVSSQEASSDRNKAEELLAKVLLRRINSKPNIRNDLSRTDDSFEI